MVFNSDIMQNMSHNLLLFCAPTWPSYQVIENHLYFTIQVKREGFFHNGVRKQALVIAILLNALYLVVTLCTLLYSFVNSNINVCRDEEVLHLLAIYVVHSHRDVHWGQSLSQLCT